jgi:hypothetical protein
MRYFLPLLLLFGAAAHWSHRLLDRATRGADSAIDPHEIMPSVEALELLSLGYRELVADYYWLRAISHYGDRDMHHANYPNLAPMLDRVLRLDPHFVEAYIFAGTALTTNQMDPKPAVALLKRGMQYRPDVWKIPFLLGFNAYYFLGDYALAAQSLGVAAKLPGAPDYTGELAARLAAEAGQPEIGIRLIDALLEQTEDQNLRAEYEQRRTLLEFEWQLRTLDALLGDFAAKHGRLATDFKELVAAGLVSAAPTDPFGGAYYIDANGKTRSPNEERRLRLAPEARPVTPDADPGKVP